jgi:UDP-glucose 4-epimerase/UDP-glucuronate decarboxylase
MQKVNKRHILITGGAGFIGYHLAHRLSQDSLNHIVMVDSFTRGKRDHDLENLAKRPNIQLIEGDLTDKATYSELGGDFDEVYHLAAIIGVRNVLERPHEVIRINITSTLLLLDWFIKYGGKKLLFSSTSEAYAWTQQFQKLPIPTPESVPMSLTDLSDPRSTYAGSKIIGELSVTQYCLHHGKPFTILRYHNVYGPRMGNAHVIPELYNRLVGGQNPLIVYSGDHSRAFCYISDAVTATIKAMRNEAANGQTINVGNDLEEITIEELARHIMSRVGMNVDIAPKPALNDPIKRRCPDIAQARRILDYNPQVSIDEGLGLCLEWYGQQI